MPFCIWYLSCEANTRMWTKRSKITRKAKKVLDGLCPGGSAQNSDFHNHARMPLHWSVHRWFCFSQWLYLRCETQTLCCYHDRHLCSLLLSGDKRDRNFHIMCKMVSKFSVDYFLTMTECHKISKRNYAKGATWRMDM